MRRINKKGEGTFEMSFGMIFSMFLIAIFVVVAFIAIKSFLNIGKTADVGLFYEDLQNAIDNIWKGQAGEVSFKIELPEKITRICFANLSANNINSALPEYREIESYEFYNHNTFLLPISEAEGFEHKEIRNINITKITKTRNPYCVDSTGTLKIKKDFYDKLVVIE